MRFYLLTLGCPKNEVDSEVMSRSLEAAGHRPVQQPDKADLLVVKTCGFIDAARKESIDNLSRLASRKANGQVLVAAGCLPELYGEKLKEEVSGIDLVLSLTDETNILDTIPKKNGGHKAGACNNCHSHKLRTSSYLKISDGCDATCAFCLIPKIKGGYQSFTSEVIVSEAQRLVGEGVKELVLVAQDTTAYGLDLGKKDGLAGLTERILADVPELHWLRLMYAYPTRVSEKLIQVMADNPQFCKYLDIPLQHAHPKVLKTMGRPHDMAQIRALISALRSAMPDIALRTSFIVGYPGETEEEFEAILNLMAEIRFDHVGAFMYSREEGTPSAKLQGHLPRRAKEKRYRRLMELQQRLSLEQNRKFIGRTLEVLVESLDDQGLAGGPHGFIGRSYRDAPEIDGLVFGRGLAKPGEIVPVRVTQALEYDLIGERLHA